MLISGAKLIILMKFCRNLQSLGGLPDITYLMYMYVHVLCFTSILLALCQFTYRYVLSHLAGICRRQVILEAFGEKEVTPIISGTCCDVCESPRKGISDCQAEISIVLKAVTDIPGNGEVNVCQQS